MPILSIIVPVYNVEKYLRRCLDSILAQTFLDYELILVDDGSKDGSGLICDEYAKTDQKISVIHKKNGGLSSARNCGIKHASGDWIGFVDSDDEIFPTMYEQMLKDGNKYNVSIVSCSFGKIVGTNFVGEEIESIYDNRVLEGRELFEWYIERKEGVSAWNKIYRKNLFENISYPEGKLHEDAFTTYKLLDKAKKIFYRNSLLYKYRIRNNSIVHSSFSLKKMDNIYAQENFYNFILNNCPELKQKAKKKYIYSIVSLIDSYILYSKDEDNEVAEKYCKIIRKNYFSLLCNSMLTFKEKIIKTPILFGYHFYYSFLKWYSKKKNR